MRRPLLVALLLSVPLLSGCSVYAQDAYAYDGYGYSAYAAVPGPVYYGGYRYYGPPRPVFGRPYYHAYRYGHRASPPPGFRGGYGHRPHGGHGGGGPHGHR